jgi:hypothetical protein
MLKFRGSLSTVSTPLSIFLQIGHLILLFRKKYERHVVQNVWPHPTTIRGIRAPTLYFSPQKWQ